MKYPKPYGLRKMIEAHDELQDASPLELIRQKNPHMTMAGMLTRVARSDARKMPAMMGAGGSSAIRLAFGAFQMIESGRPAEEARRLLEMV